MAKLSGPYVREAFVSLLYDAPSVAEVVADRVYGAQRPPKPDWPFLAAGTTTTVPFGASCLDGSQVSLVVHGYAQTAGTGDATVSGEEAADDLMARALAVLGDATIDLTQFGCPYPATAHVGWTNVQNIQDGSDASAFHSFANFLVTVSS